MTMDFYPGMGRAVAERTILRKKQNGEWESWGDVAERVALGSSLLCKDVDEQKQEYTKLKYHIGNGNLLMSGRHLQHGDAEQASRNMEVFTNCATACNTFSLFYLLMNGSGAGRSYDDDLMIVDWDNAPNLRCVLSHEHPDFDYSAHESVRDAEHKYGRNNPRVRWHEVADDREGWAKAVEVYENLAFEKINHDTTLVLDFSKVRKKGSPIKGMQGRPASGPVPLMNAFNKAASIKGSGMSRWKQTLYIDHYFAECVLVGGARRAARMATKNWRDKDVFGFIEVKRPTEFLYKSMEEIAAHKKDYGSLGSFLWSSNNSVAVDEEFWDCVNHKRDTKLGRHAQAVFNAITAAAYGDGTGEPGILNIHRLHQSRDGIKAIKKYVHSAKYSVDRDSHIYLSKLLDAAKLKDCFMICNPCAEIALSVWGAFCTIADVVPYQASTLDEAEDAFRVATRSLIRVNTMNSIYGEEVKRTNRIGVGITGIHEFAWKFFGYGFHDLIDESKSKDFWMALSRFKCAVRDEAVKYSKHIGVNTPMTDTTIKPAGTTSKLFGLTEGWHLPAMESYLRWVQFSVNDPLVQQYRDAGYPTLELKTYKNTVIVGFPTQPLIATLGMGDKLVTAANATPEEQYQWLMLGEKYWIRGVDDEGNPLAEDTGNQISYTLKYDPKAVSYEQFRDTLLKYQSRVKCCSVMPVEDTSSYEYLPEQPITKAEYEAIAARIRVAKSEDVDKVHVDCVGGACPVDFNKS